MKTVNKLGFRWLIALLVCLMTTSHANAEKFENYSSIGGSTERELIRTKEIKCKYYYHCGPTSTIELTMLTADGETTAAFGDSSINYDVGAVGTFEQMLKRGEDFNKNGLSSAITEMIKKGEEYKGGKIRIVFPMIDYGYTGTFNNIEISVHEQNERLSTATRDEYTGGVTGFTGSVTIEKYSPSTMKGSYSGTLYRYVDANLPYRGPLPHQRVKIIVGAGTGSVNGEFTIINPWKDDDRISDGIDYQSAIVDPMKDDIKRMVDKR